MTLLDLAKLYNFSGVATVLAVSLWVASRYPSAYFRPWLGAYLAGLGLLACELAAGWGAGRPGFHAVQALLVVVVMGLFLKTGRALAGRAVTNGAIALAAAGVGLAAFGWVASGHAFLQLFGPLVLVYAGTHLWLGWRLFALRASNRHWLGGALIASGLWFFTYPVLSVSAYAWVGYLVSGLLNMAVGMGMALLLVDQTARELSASKDRLARDVDRSTTFIHAMSHELRTPLNAIKTAAFLVGRTEAERLSSKHQELLGIIDHQSELLNRLVEDLLDHSRIESGLLTCQPEPVDLAGLVARAIHAVEKEFDAKGVALVLTGAEQPLPLEADGARIMQVVTNLLANAQKFTPAGGRVQVHVGIAGGHAWMEVTDTGIGIAPEHHEAIFQKYFQVDASTRRKAGGLGLGLAIARVIVEDGHHGALRVQSQLGHGATFRVELPLEAPVAVAERGMISA